jgi:hypothetical protein
MKMNTSTTKIGKVATALVLASAIGGLGMTPAFGDERDNRDNDARNYNAQDRGHNTAPVRHEFRSKSHHPRYYAQPVYAPPPDYYRPRPSPGIALFIPFNLR